MEETFNICFQPGFLRVVYLIKFALNLARYIVPLGLIIKVGMDIYKGVLNPKDFEGKTIIRNRIIACIVIFILPLITNLIIKFINYSLTADVYTGVTECWEWASPAYIDKMQVIYDEKLYNDYITEEEEEALDDASKAKVLLQRVQAETTLTVDIGEYQNTGDWIRCGSGPSYNEELFKYVKSAGSKTRNGVVAAATYLSTRVNLNIPYLWAGGHVYNPAEVTTGFSKNWGCNTGNNSYPLDGLDCSGFVLWAIMNGGYYTGDNYIGFETKSFHAGDSIPYDSPTFGGISINSISVANAVGKAQPGDLIWYYNAVKSAGHVGMIIKVTGNTFWVAHESGVSVGLIVTELTFSQANKFTHIILMDNFYENYQKDKAIWSGFNT